MGNRTFNVQLERGASFDEVKSKLQRVGLDIVREVPVFRFLSGNIAEELESDLRAVEGVETVEPDREVGLA